MKYILCRLLIWFLLADFFLALSTFSMQVASRAKVIFRRLGLVICDDSIVAPDPRPTIRVCISPMTPVTLQSNSFQVLQLVLRDLLLLLLLIPSFLQLFEYSSSRDASCLHFVVTLLSTRHLENKERTGKLTAKTAINQSAYAKTHACPGRLLFKLPYSMHTIFWKGHG